MTQMPFGEDNRYVASQEIPLILWNWKVHHHVSNILSQGPIPSPINPAHAHPSYFFIESILILSSHLCLALASGLFPSGFPIKTLYAFLFPTT